MEKAFGIELNSPVYKVIHQQQQHKLLLLSANTFFEVDIAGRSWKQHIIKELEVILDITWQEGLYIIAGVGNLPVMYDVASEKVLGLIGEPVGEKNAYSVVTFIYNRLYCANVYTDMIEVWDIEARRKETELVSGNFVKQLVWDADAQTLIVVASDSEDSGFLLFNVIDKDNRIHSLDVMLECYFSVSKVAFSKNKKQLFIAGGFPPLNVQIHSYPGLDYEKEFVLAEDYPNDTFGNEIGYSFNIDFQLLDNQEMIFPYSGGDLFKINYGNNTFQRIYSDEYQWIYSRVHGNYLVAVAEEGVVYYFNNEWGSSADGGEYIGSGTGVKPDFGEVELKFPLVQRNVLAPENEDADELVEEVL
ncbi:hypothetical protein SAMN05421788_101293 [Filimonas lacunae]|uniref:WD40-like Beta Propeller Repeat n=1 Tax=Filimonas lacunae TaxID=477680 RepID=A0A173MN12_9BACT|nr:hypothetical protein [Filimonas lacunae]BAV08840.1 hypothetical protein FLA_4887 [Filimonas lacunae]SIS62602.1 hypothetical protein SAMN05421788_101293 [Filimonas lacunae]